MVVSTANQWARQEVIGGNKVRQLLVPECADMQVDDSGDELQLHSRYGRWPACRGSSAASDGRLAAVLPVVRTGRTRVEWVGSNDMVPPTDVLASYLGAIGFRPYDEPHSLRRPQIAALHSIVGYQSSGLDDPALVVMPTGTGKTETMIAWMVATRPEKLLVLVPSAALRDQLAAKFECLGVLQREQIVAHSAMRPCVGWLEHGFTDPSEAQRFVDACNVIVATPQALNASKLAAKDALLSACTHLVVDEAHHAPAPTWSGAIDQFAGRPVLLFTATPFRSDGRVIPGRTIFRFPLREAQKYGYFSQINFRSVVALDHPDNELARAAIGQLREDRSAGLDHVLMVRTNTKSRAEDLGAVYTELAPEYQVRTLYDSLTTSKKRDVMRALEAGECHVVVCVGMLGEGYDLPTLKIAAIHDVHKSLSPALQLIGRFARTQSDKAIGRASVFIGQDPATALSPLRALLREDPDWNVVLSNVTDNATARADEVADFEEGFSLTPSNVPVGLLEPTMSAVAFQTAVTEWEPDRAVQIYGHDILDGVVSQNAAGDVAWFIIESTGELRWGDVPGLAPVTYTLVIMYFDSIRGLLFVHGSDTKKSYAQLATAVLGEEPVQIRGIDPFRVFAGLDRLIPTNVGLLDSRDRDRRFSLHVGSDIGAALTDAERENKTNTHVQGRAFDDGERVTIAAALSGRFWSPRSAEGLIEWRDWCRHQGTKLLNRSVDIRSLFHDMIIPTDVISRPPFPLLALEWPWDLYLGNGTIQKATFNDDSYLLTDLEFAVDDYSDDGPFKFSVVSPTWRVSFQADVGHTGLHYQARGHDAVVHGRAGTTTPLANWLNNHKPTLFLSGDRMITDDDRLLEPRTDVAPYDRDKFKVLDWDGVTITVESQGLERRSDSIQAYMSAHLRTTQQFDVLIDDDRSGEAADLVGLRVDQDQLLVTLVHCKYSSRDRAGGRLVDVYEVCGQAIRGARWRNNFAEPLLMHLQRRTEAYFERTGGSAYEVGDRRALLRVRERARLLRPRFVTIVAQPGLSKAASTDEQLRVISAAANYVQAVTKGSFAVYCSD